MKNPASSRSLFPHAQRYLIAGVLALIPLWVTWIVFDFLLTQLSRVGRPWVQGFARIFDRVAPGVAGFFAHPWFEAALGVALALAGLYALGWATSRVLGRRLLEWFEATLDRIPLVKAIYGAARKLVSAFQTRPEGVQRVVLINFPSSEMKAVAFVTRTLVDQETGRELAVVYVPTTPNPTSGYMEIVPMERVTATDWTIEEAMRFVITGGTSAPDAIRYGGGPASAPR
jgi:uncharacterized membrane protein